MAKNLNDELKRLANGLLAEDEAPARQEDADIDGFFLEENDTVPADVQVPYRNFANGYQAKTNQPSDVDLDSFSDEVYGAKAPSNKPLIILALILLTCNIALLCWWVWRLGGIA
jgi:hypothetical protein